MFWRARSRREGARFSSFFTRFVYRAAIATMRGWFIQFYYYDWILNCLYAARHACISNALHIYIPPSRLALFNNETKICTWQRETSFFLFNFTCLFSWVFIQEKLCVVRYVYRIQEPKYKSLRAREKITYNQSAPWKRLPLTIIQWNV